MTDFASHLRSQEGISPLLLLPDERPPHMLVDMGRKVAKQLQHLLSAPNKHLGQPFLSGNFAPVHKELHATRLPLLVTSQPTAALPATASLQKPAALTADDTSAQKDTAAPSDQSVVHLNISAVTSGTALVQEQSVAAGSSDTSSNSNNSTTHSSKHHKLSGAAQLPEGLSGAFMRIGPNPLLAPLGGYHWFDGDGMVHAVRIKDGSASYCNRWVPTSRLAQEVAAGWPMFMKLGDYVGWRALALLLLHRIKCSLGLVDTSNGGGTANTAMVCHASRLLALHEGDMPHALRLLCDGLIEAVGRVMVSRPVGKSFTAHPKLDPVTGELHFFRYTFDAAPYVSYGVLGPRGELTASVDIGAANLRRPVMMHDFAITEHWVVFMDHPLCFDGERMVKQGNLPFKFKAEQGSRVGLLRRGAPDDSSMLWFDLPAHMVFHVGNAYEEADGTVKLFVCHSKTISLNLDTRTSGDIPEDEQPCLAVVTLNPSCGTSTTGTNCSSSSSSGRQGSLQLMTKTAGDFPTINPAFVGRKNRWAYVATMQTGFGAAVKWDGVAKMDLWAADGVDAQVARIKLPDGCFNGETVFVPRFEDPTKCASEDDGYLMTFVHDEDNNSSSLVVWDALSMAPEPLAVVALPQRVPYGFHGLWVTESQVQQQLKGHALEPMSVAS